MDIKYVITVDSAGATKNVQNFDKAIEALGKTTTTGAKPAVQSFGQELSSKLIPAFTVATLAADALKKSFRFMKDQLVDTIEAAIEAEKVDRALGATLNIVGQASGGTADKLKGQAAALMRLTLYDDEAIKSAQALIVTMRGTVSQIDLATKGAIGLASVFLMDLQSAARAVAQGFEGNYRQLGMLIPAIRDAKTETEKHAAMMDFLAGAYKRAESDVHAFGGKIVDLKDAYKELQESIGTFVIQNKTVIDTLSGVKEIIIWMDRKAQEQPKEQGLLGKLFKWTAPGAMLESLRGIGEAAKQANKEWDESFNGMTASMFAFRKTALDPIPIKIIDTKWQMKKFYDLQMQLLATHRAAKELTSIQFITLSGDLFGKWALEKNRHELTRLPPAINRVELVMKSLALASQNTGRMMKRTWEEAAAAAVRYSETAGASLGAFDAVVAQGTANRMIAIDNEYRRRRDMIEATIKDEGERQDAFEKLDKEFEGKKRKAQRVLALSNKAVAISNAIISTHEAAAKAMAQGGFLLGIPWSAIITALGWAQVAMIAAQPIPLAKGGYFKEPTLLPGRDGRTYLGGDAGPEIVSPVAMMRDIVRDELRAFGGGRTLSIPAIHIHVAQTTTAADIRRLGPAVYGAVKDEFRIHGYKLEKR